MRGRLETRRLVVGSEVRRLDEEDWGQKEKRRDGIGVMKLMPGRLELRILGMGLWARRLGLEDWR